MVVKKVISEMLPKIWPMLAFILVVAVTLRCAYLFKGNKKFVLHKELLALIFIIYILCLYYILMGQEYGNGGVNLIPFKEMFSYKFGSYLFMQNIVGTILLFVPFGFFSSYYLNNRKASLIFLVTLIVSACSAGLIYYLKGIFSIDKVILSVFGGIVGYLLCVALLAIKDKLPKFMKSDAFLNLVIIILVILIVLYSVDINILNYL